MFIDKSLNIDGCLIHTAFLAGRAGDETAVHASLAVVNRICAIIERNAVNRSLIKTLNPTAGNAVRPGSVRLSFFSGI
jgi:hypothetical protein